MERTILIAEDSPTQAEHLRLLLEGEGYRVEWARSGREGLQRAEAAPPDLIISDVMMPEMDGYAFCQAVKSHDRLQRIPFVLLTGRSTTADIITGFERGADNFITKPFEDDYLLERVRRIFENLDLRRRGRLDVEVSLTVAGREIVINADKQQMIELLFATLEDLVRTNARLQQEEAYTRSLVESSVDALITTDTRGVITDVNRRMCEVTGAAREALVGTPFRDCFADGVRAEDAIRRVLAEDQVMDYELVLERRDGSGLTVSCNATAVRGLDGDARGVFVAARDISEQKRLEAQLRRKNDELEAQYRRLQEANRLKSEFLANMSHELRTPLNGIIGFTELLHDAKVGTVSGEQKEYLGDILTSSRHLLQLINDVLDLSKIEAGKMEFRPQPVRVETLVREVRDTVRTFAAEKRITIDVSIDPAVEEIVADPGKLKQVLYNFLSNALKFTRDGGGVAIRVVPEDDDMFRLEVADNGIGIAPGDVPKLFTEFQQLDAGTGKRYPGTGLGLALTKRIVEAQRGRVGVHSTPGEGSIFFAALPRVMVSTQETDAPAFPAGSDVPLVLVVEDDPRDQRLIAETLARAGYAVETVATGRAAIARCREQAYAAITLDLLLPDIPGQETLAAVRADGPNRATPVLIVSVVADQGLVLGFNVHDILTKPVRPEALLRSLERLDVRPDSPGPVLVVDDDAQARRLAERALTNRGYRAISRPDAEAGLRAAAETPPAAVILDLVMPGVSGFEFLLRFRRTPHGRGTPVIVWTAKDLSPDERRRLALSTHAIVEKSHGTQALLDELAALVSRAATAPAAKRRRRSSD